MGSPSFTVDARDFDKAAKALSREGYEAQAGRTAAWAIRRAINAARRTIRARARPHRKTGRMAGNVRTRFRGRGLDLVGGVKATGSGSNLIVGGVRAHPIASDKPMPLWAGKGKSGAIEGYARAVEHPGFPADPFVEKGIRDAMPEINRIVSEAAATMVRELAFRMSRRS